jgi:hypothetical protein
MIAEQLCNKAKYCMNFKAKSFKNLDFQIRPPKCPPLHEQLNSSNKIRRLKQAWKDE